MEERERERAPKGSRDNMATPFVCSNSHSLSELLKHDELIWLLANSTLVYCPVIYITSVFSCECHTG